MILSLLLPGFLFPASSVTVKVNIPFNYRFGKDDFKTRSNRTTASSEEQSRSSK
jgi:hypothetical protein